ncbi:hypothetical protein [Prescottella equi]|uniref:hypothetical protein n=1 Tax=Rhodococcus hoagii TaxID=43767 RepID=UPI000A0F4A89|nr:hypothetical protein [Prescottella equi]ORM18350.1 hypothetical protein A5N74_12170 [Prescottella equi]
MTDLHADITDIGGGRGDGFASMTSTVLRPANSRTGTIAPVLPYTVKIVDGQFTMTNLDPGPAKLEIRIGAWVEEWPVNIPDSSEPITFKTLLDNYIEHEPGVVSEVRVHADRAETSAVRSESAADRADAALDNVVEVMGTAADGVRALVESDANRAQQAAADADADRVAAAGSAAAAYTSRQEAVQYATYAGSVASQAAGHKDAAQEARTGSETARDASVAAKEGASAARVGAETAQGAAEAAAAAAADDATAALQQAVAADRQAAQAARTGAESAATTALGHEDAAEGFAAAADASAQAADTARLLAEAAAEHAQTGAPAGGWPRSNLEETVQQDLLRARSALQEVPVATAEAPGAIKLTGHLAGTASDPQIAENVVEFRHLVEEVGEAVYLAALMRSASFDETGEYIGLPIGMFQNDIRDAVARAAFAYIKPVMGIPGEDLADGAVDLDQLSDVEPAPSTPSVKAAVGFAAEILTTFNVNDGWTRDNLTQSVQDDLGKAATAMQGSKNGTPTTFTVWVGTEAQYNVATNNGTNEAPNTIYLRGA